MVHDMCISCCYVPPGAAVPLELESVVYYDACACLYSTAVAVTAQYDIRTPPPRARKLFVAELQPEATRRHTYVCMYAYNLTSVQDIYIYMYIYIIYIVLNEYK